MTALPAFRIQVPHDDPARAPMVQLDTDDLDEAVRAGWDMHNAFRQAAELLQRDPDSGELAKIADVGVVFVAGYGE